MANGGNADTVGSEKLIDGRVWIIVAVHPIRITQSSDDVTEEPK